MTYHRRENKKISKDKKFSEVGILLKKVGEKQEDCKEYLKKKRREGGTERGRTEGRRTGGRTERGREEKKMVQ